MHTGPDMIRWFMTFAVLFITTTCVAAQIDFPNRPVRVIVPQPPGASTDLTARLVAQKLADALGQPVIVDNRPGAGSTTGTEFVAKSPPDGNTLLMTSASF